MTEVTHSISRETFWILAAYSNTTSSHVTSRQSLQSFYITLLQRLIEFMTNLQSMEMWNSCIAARDWNMVEYPEDCSPPHRLDRTDCVTQDAFKDIKTICLMTDTAGAGALPKLWSCKAKAGLITSRIDWVY
jgi:hypothetical protein